MKRAEFHRFLLMLLLIGSAAPLAAQESLTGIVAGRVLDRRTQRPLAGISVLILGTRLGASTDTTGFFTIERVPVGACRVRFSGVGYEPKVVTDLVVGTGRRTALNAELEERVYETGGMTIEANYFRKNAEDPTSAHSFRFEEIRRAAGAAEDVSRVVQSLPGVAATTDARNDLVVRGGSPTENLTLLDNIEVPNANHFGTQGATGGPISMINTDFIDEVRFFTGGFDAQFGDKLSSVLDIRMREGSQAGFAGNINLSSAGAGGVFEGPAGEHANWMVSARKSFLDLLVSPLGLSATPHYSNAQFKAVWRPNPSNLFSVIGLGGIDEILLSSNDRNEQEPRVMYLNTRDLQNQYTVGARWKSLWGARGFSEIDLSLSGSNYLIDVKDTLGAYVFRNASEELELQGKAELFYRVSSMIDLQGGISLKPVRFHHDLFAEADTTPLGFTYPVLSYDRQSRASKQAAFAQATIRLLPPLSVTAGLRADYFTLTRRLDISPRFGASWEFSPVTTLNVSVGRYCQTPTYLWISSDPGNTFLRSVRADHYIVGVDHYLAADCKVSIEAYDKEYADYPVSLLVPTFCFANGGADYGIFIGGPAANAGIGFARGIDIYLQKKMTERFYGIVSYSWSLAEFRALEGGWKPGNFDYRHVFTINGGVKLSGAWEVSAKWRYAGGRPYTPFNVALSTLARRGIADFDRINSARYPPYHRLDLRADYRINFDRWNIVTYLELQNVYNRTNVYAYFWDDAHNRQDQVNQWAFFPVGGFSLQF